MERKFIKVEKNNEITNVIINRPSKLNALSQSLIQELETVIKLLSKDENIRCVIISGEGRAFSSGADIIELKSLTQPDARRFITLLHKAFQAIRDCPVPVIAKIDGPCLGGGLELAICCDIRAASERSTFGMPEVQVGVPSVIEAALLPRLIGWGRTSEMLFTGRILTADEAMISGIVEKVVPFETIDAAIDILTNSILSASPSAIRAQKSLMRQWEKLSLDDAINQGISFFEKAYK